MTEPFSFRYEPRLTEEAVFLAQRNGQTVGNLSRQRNYIYEIVDPGKRERLFNKLYEAWFVRLGLGQPIEQAFREQPLILSQVKACLVGRAAKAADEGAELFVRSDENSARRTVRILLRPESLLSPELLTLLRHELFHIADMLDPAYGYEPALPSSGVGPTYDQLLTNRYRLLWDITIDSRMLRRGWAPQTVRTTHLAHFNEAFPALQDQADDLFAAFFERDAHTHGELVAFALNPRNASPAAEPCAGNRCPLCGFPTHSFEPNPEQLEGHTLAAIRQDFPQWQPSAGLCRQCADLYRANRLSLEAARLLPGAAPESKNHLRSFGSDLRHIFLPPR